MEVIDGEESMLHLYVFTHRSVAHVLDPAVQHGGLPHDGGHVARRHVVEEGSLGQREEPLPGLQLGGEPREARWTWENKIYFDVKFVL